ncbi:2435_t:CDS:1 [Cetraspora pellucida]|uniref:2435_t:CDS:1 n=1 Tax=Cetraspora pellucida TaxID=1433469 RepID=A0ACA9N3I5_9GLOM|nr:2435_t:CDS:1 [Cetraspora pellucida]
MDNVINVAFFGLTGGGKSTIANMLYDGNLSGEDYFKIADSAKGVTESITIASNEKFGIYDTVGFGEGKSGTVEHSKAIKLIRKFFSVPAVEFNYLCYVKGKGRFTDDDRKRFNEFKVVFNDGEKNIIIIITRCKQEWVDDNRITIKEYFGDYPVIAVDFPPDKKDDNIAKQQKKRERRAESLNRLQDTFAILGYKGIRLEVLSPPEHIENKIQKFIRFVPVVNGFYKITSSGVYYLKGKPKIAGQRLIEGTWCFLETAFILV